MRARGIIKLLAIVALVAAIAVAMRFLLPSGAAPQSAGEGGKSQAAAAPTRGGQLPAVPVFAAKASARDVPIIIRGIGSVQAFNTVTVKSRVDGNIVKVAFREGQNVRAGDLLVQIDPRPYQAQLEQAEANKAKDAASLQNAQRDLARLASLMQSQLAATRQQYETQQALVAQLTAAAQADQAQIETARLNVAYCAIASPIDGVTGLRLVDIGNLVTASAATPLVVVTQIEPIYVTFSAPERDLGRIRAAMAKEALTVLAFDGEDRQQLAEGRLRLVNNTVDQATGTVTLKAEFANKDAALWPGEFVNAHLVVAVVRNGVTMPAGAVQMGPTGPFVYLVKPDSTVVPQPVTVTQVEAGVALIGDGLQIGDTIVTSGQAGLSPGARVAVQQGEPGELNAREPQIGPQGVGSTGITTAPPGAGGTVAR
jgi:multidrug efflux system membrane fusion protein